MCGVQANQPGRLCTPCSLTPEGAVIVEEARKAKGAKAARPETLLPVGNDDPLEVMRHVKGSPVDLTYQHWESRQWKKKNEAKWQEAWLTLERVRGGSGSGAPAAPVAPSSASTTVSTALVAPQPGEVCPLCRHKAPLPDLGAERLKELIQKLREAGA